MRITGGSKKGSVLLSPKGKTIRPSSDYIRQVIFNIIGHNLSGKKVLDLFSGTGILGIEALSRGADYVCFVDKSPYSLRLIKKNLELTGYTKKAILLKIDLIRMHLKSKKKFDIVFIDPPYDTGLLCKMINILPVKEILQDEAIIVGRSSKRESVPSCINHISLSDIRTYGDTKLWIFLYGDKK